MDNVSRVARERERYNEGLERTAYRDLFTHAQHFYRERRRRILSRVMHHAQGRSVLELGSLSWVDWIERRDIVPARYGSVSGGQAGTQLHRSLPKSQFELPLWTADGQDSVLSTGLESFIAEPHH